MRDERKKQARSNKQGKATQHTTTLYTLDRALYQLNYRGSSAWLGPNLYSRQSALPTELPRQLSWLGPNLTSHSTPDEQANHQLYIYIIVLIGLVHIHVHVHVCVITSFLSSLLLSTRWPPTAYQKDNHVLAIMVGTESTFFALFAITLYMAGCNEVFIATKQTLMCKLSTYSSVKCSRLTSRLCPCRQSTSVRVSCSTLWW